MTTLPPPPSPPSPPPEDGPGPPPSVALGVEVRTKVLHTVLGACVESGGNVKAEGKVSGADAEDCVLNHIEAGALFRACSAVHD